MQEASRQALALAFHLKSRALQGKSPSLLPGSKCDKAHAIFKTTTEKIKRNSKVWTARIIHGALSPDGVLIFTWLVIFKINVLGNS